MWPKFMNSKLFTIILASALSVIGTLFTQRLTEKREDQKDIKYELSIRPSYSYVDKQDESLRRDFLKSDQDLKEFMNNTMVETNNSLRELRSYILKK